MTTAKKRRRNRKIKYAVLTVLTVFLSVLIGAGVWAIDFWNSLEEDPGWIVSTQTPGSTPSNLPTQTPLGSPDTSPVGTPAPTPDVTPGEELVFGKEVLNVLVMGYDSSDDRDSGTYNIFRTDVLMLCTVYFEEGRVAITSVPRDSYVPIGPSFARMDKINSAFAHAQASGGDPYSAVCATVSRLFGNVPVDYFVSIDMDVFVEAIDALGGIEYDVDVDIIYNGDVILKKGKQVLSGKQALEYVSFRKTANGDIGRVERQQRFIKAAFSQLKSMDKLSKLPEVYSLVMDKMYTNLSYKQIAYFARFAVENMGGSSISTKTFPGSFLNMNGISYWGIDQYQRRLLVHELFGKTIQQEDWY